MRFEKIWVQQCRATKTIKRRFGAKSALDYLIREKLITYADEAERSPEYAKELPRFLAAIWQVFNQFKVPRMPTRSSTGTVRSRNMPSRQWTSPHALHASRS